MTITVQIPSVLQPCCEGAEEFTVSARTVGAVLAQIERRHPELYRSICDDTGAVRQHVNLFVNSALWPKDGQDTKLKPGDVIAIFQAVSGG